jgi:exopolyphosphatase / guanosine-5'-triphosphate,3'-diphosphate pyrophosphatase
VRAEIGQAVGDLLRFGRPDKVVASSKTFRQLARVAGAASSSFGLYTPRRLARADLLGVLPRLTKMTVAERAALPGVSAGRAHQLVAGAIVADAAIDLFETEVVDISPWALREGIILRRLDGLPEEWL